MVRYCCVLALHYLWRLCFDLTFSIAVSEMNVINKVTKNQDNSLRSLRSAHCKDVKASNRKTGNTSDMAIDAVATDTASSVLVDQTDDYIQSGMVPYLRIRIVVL